MYLKNNTFISMIPYPSGSVHVGHSRNYIINDLLNRFFFFKNFYKSKMFMGWDGFGSPAEIASFKKNINPSNYLKYNTYYMKKQLSYCDFSINWIFVLKTYNFNYYYFNQFILLKFLIDNLLYLSYKKANWDICEKTILSNEQVINGKGWRSLCNIKKLNVKTYYFNIKNYKNEIFNEIENLDWPIKIKLMQRSWIYFINYFFFLKIFSKTISYKKFFNFYSFYYFLFYIFLSSFNLEKYFFLKFIILKKILNIGYYLKNTFDYKIYFLNFKEKKYYYNFNKKFNVFFFLKNFNIFILNSFYFLNTFELFRIFKFKNIIFLKGYWNIKDWGISRQKYWGSNIPSFFCDFCKNNYFSINYNLPNLVSNNLKNNNFYYFKFINKINCKFCCNKNYKEIFTMDTFVDSSWYFLKFFLKRFFINLNLPIDIYIGGIEHSILHLLYSRYFIKVLRDSKFLNFGEPFRKVFSQGMILYKDNNKILKMSKSSGFSVNPEKLIVDYSVDAFRFTLLKNSLNKDYLWNNKFVKINYFFLKKLFFIKFRFSFKNKKNIFLKNFKIIKNLKVFNNFIIKNFKKISFFLKNLIFNYSLIFFIKIFKLFKKKNILKFINYFFLKKFFFKLIKIFYFLFPNTFNIYFIKWKFYKFLKLKNLYYNVLKKIIFKKINFMKINLLLKNKKLGTFFLNKIFKKKVYNFLFFKKKIFKTFFMKIIFIKNVLNIFLNKK